MATNTKHRERRSRVVDTPVSAGDNGADAAPATPYNHSPTQSYHSLTLYIHLHLLLLTQEKLQRFLISLKTLYVNVKPFITPAYTEDARKSQLKTIYIYYLYMLQIHQQIYVDVIKQIIKNINYLIFFLLKIFNIFWFTNDVIINIAAFII